ncbi:uncharacterized protein LOC115990240 [Quercus lobata]|uniref:uncharacterized protein LOC115990240 n=1 Tax=Quercus lobata TaxID=97700 RepID=UPI001248F547|nr:uncharacterized protein LOC115990240 [Quercus lobata]
MCPICKRFPEATIHALWECGAAQDMWVGCSHHTLQKGLTNQETVMNLSWQPPEGMMYKLNFDAAVLTDTSASGVGVIIRNDRGQVMVALSSKGLAVTNSKEAEVLACRQAMEFVLDAGFSDLIMEGDDSNVIRSIVSAQIDWSHLGNLYDDIRCLAGRLRHVEFRGIRRITNEVAHSLARFARHLSEDIVWLEDSPPPALEALYSDSISIAN